MSDNEDVKCGWKTRADELSASLVQVAQALDAAKADAARLEEQVQALTVERDFARKEFYEQLQATFSRMEERDAAKADAARLREALAEIARPKRGGIEANDSDEEWFEYLRNALERDRAIARAALAATDSGEWLAKHDAEVRAPLERRIAELEAEQEKFDARKWLVDSQQADSRHLRAQVDTLTKQLAAATNDAARAELRARNAVELWSRFDALSASNAGNSDNRFEMAFVELEEEIRAALAAAPDSDARLREVMLKVAVMAHDEGAENMREQNNEPSLAIAVRVVGEVLEVKS